VTYAERVQTLVAAKTLLGAVEEDLDARKVACSGCGLNRALNHAEAIIAEQLFVMAARIDRIVDRLTVAEQRRESFTKK
jgi:hypothetical protein